MSTITKEWLQQKIADMEARRDDPWLGLDEDESNTLAALRIALASLEADGDSEPVAFINGAWTLVYYRPPKELGLKIGDKLYTATPAPVSVPDEMYWQNAPVEGSTRAAAYATGWNACRAAMLQGADGNSPAHSDCCPEQNCIAPAQDGKSPVIPDGWVSCSERMPDIGTEIFYFCQDDGQRDCGIVSSSNFSGKGDAELYVHAEGYDLRFGVDITHWMPLPAAPQQEVKNG